MSKDYGQFCGLARAASIIGERWALLILRDLMVSSKRFSDLREGLPGVPSNVLTTRLRELESSGIIARHVMPLPRRGTVYALTDYGQTLQPILDALGRWGAQRMVEPADGEVVTDASLAAALRAGFHHGVASRERTFAVAAGEARAWARATAVDVSIGEGDTDQADLTIVGGMALRPLLAGELSPADALSSGDIAVEGDESLLTEFAQIFHVPWDLSTTNH